jgi:hypothetical protein
MRQASDLIPDSSGAKKRCLQMVPPLKLDTCSQAISSFQAESSSIDLMNDLHTLGEVPKPLDRRGATATIQATLKTHYSRQASYGTGGEPIMHSRRSVGASSNDTEEWDGSTSFVVSSSTTSK